MNIVMKYRKRVYILGYFRARALEISRGCEARAIHCRFHMRANSTCNGDDDTSLNISTSDTSSHILMQCR